MSSLMMVESGTVRLAGMFDELMLADEAEQVEAGVQQIARWCQRDPELGRIYDALLAMGDARADEPPVGWDLDAATCNWLQHYPDDLLDIPVATWFWRMEQAYQSPEGQRLCALRDVRLAALSAEATA